MDIKALGYIGIESTDPEQWRHYATRVVGMVVAPAMPDSDLFLKMDEYSWRIRVFKGETDRLAIAGWELANKADFDQALAELKAYDIAFEHGSAQQCAERRVKEFVRLQDPAGGVLELFYHMQLDYQRLNSAAGINNFITGYHGDMGLGHYVIPTNNFDETFAFYTQILGFGETACVHLMFEVEDINEVGYFIDRCKQNDVNIVSSLGRHTNDLMISVYAASPGGFAIEYGCDGVQLDWDNYKPTESSVPSLWGHDWAG